MFDIFDAFIAVWQTVLTLLAYHPWAAGIPALFILINESIKKYDKYKFPDS